MLLKRLLQVAGILLAILGGIQGYNYFSRSADTVDHRLAKKAFAEIQDRHEIFDGHVLEFKLLEPGVYRVETEGLSDARSVGNCAYNTMAVLIMARWKLQAARNVFTLYGYEGEQLIFEVTNTQYDEPIVTLKGPYEGDEYNPAFGPQSSAGPSIRNGKVDTNIFNHA